MPRTIKPHLCRRCGENDPLKFRGVSKSWCRSCDKDNSIQTKKLRFDADPIYKKATHAIGGLQWGRGGAEKMKTLLVSYLGKNCKYCDIELTLKNMSLDHKIPLAHAVRKKSKITTYSRDYGMTPEEIVWHNSEANLHFVCLTCNRSKGNLTDDEYTLLLNFLTDHPRMKQIVIAKLKGSNFMYRKY